MDIGNRDFWCNTNRDIRAKPYCWNVHGPNRTNSGEVYISGHLTTRAILKIFHHDFSGVGCSAWTVWALQTKSPHTFGQHWLTHSLTHEHRLVSQHANPQQRQSEELKFCTTFLTGGLLILLGPGSVGGIATGYGLNGLGTESRWRRDFPHLFRPALGPT